MVKNSLLYGTQKHTLVYAKCHLQSALGVAKSRKQYQELIY